MYKIFTQCLCLALLCGAAGVPAQTLKIPVGEQAARHTGPLPQRGQSPDSVLRTHGQPLKRHASVGQPPITRWDYPEFSVYFEHNHVINSVLQHQGPQQ